MRSLFARLGDIESCPTCRIEKREKYNAVIICASCKEAEKSREQRLSSMTLEEFICEVVNSRAEVGECDNHYQTLFEHYLEDMPYGTAKARDGDPYEWILNRLVHDHPELIEEDVIA